MDTLREHLRKAGSVKSERKSMSSKINGAKGGRPAYEYLCDEAGMPIIFYLADSKKGYTSGTFLPNIHEASIRGRYDKKQKSFIVDSDSPFISMTISAAAENIDEAFTNKRADIEREHWTTDRSLAERQTAKMIELRLSGKMKFRGPVRTHLKECFAEIWAVK